ncbi:hypothetical protein ALC53_06682 [Atta colombica]|uniref:Uncharacterized protein n=1 Tax=Atta colombica TaxID=520822 RepID=A0A151I303_9HYME|nr:hypothetical protein ALC53_06682 [Atta colombica]
MAQAICNYQWTKEWQRLSDWHKVHEKTFKELLSDASNTLR